MFIRLQNLLERQRDRETERQRETERDRERDRERQRETERGRERDRERQGETETERESEREREYKLTRLAVIVKKEIVNFKGRFEQISTEAVLTF